MSRFATNTLITFLTRMLQVLLGVCSSIIIARSLGPEGRGVYALALLLPSVLVLVMELGMGPASTYYVARNISNAKDILTINIVSALAIGVMAVLFGGILIMYYGSVLFPGVDPVYLWFALLMIPFQLFMLFASNILLGMQKLPSYNLVNISKNVIRRVFLCSK